jgi:Enterobacteriaceae phage serine recombinase
MLVGPAGSGHTWHRVMHRTKPGEVLIVWQRDRLGCLLCNLVWRLDGLQARSVAFRWLTEGIDTATPTGGAMEHMVGRLAELA